ncbi:phospholipase-like protein [Tanacetum coccineum]
MGFHPDLECHCNIREWKQQEDTSNSMEKREELEVLSLVTDGLQVFIPINEPLRHWSLVMFHICSRVVTFYDSERTEGGEYRRWYLQTRDCLKEKIPVVLKETGVFEKKIIDLVKYKISFKVADGVPKQGGVFGDCGVFPCMFLYRLANDIPLALDDPLQSALAYREKLIHFYFKH